MTIACNLMYAQLSINRNSTTKADLVNPFLGTATLWEKEDLGYEHTWKTRAWGAETYPGAALPFSMVQLSPVTMYHSGSGYQYEDTTITGFAHTNKGHWNLLHLPMMPATGEFTPSDYASEFSHEQESATPGYYQVFLPRYGVNAEFTVTPRCGFHRYTFSDAAATKKLIIDHLKANNSVRRAEVKQCDGHTLEGFQVAEGCMFMHAESNYEIESVREVRDTAGCFTVVTFKPRSDNAPLEIRAGFSFTDLQGARLNYNTEIAGQSFEQVAAQAHKTWAELLGKVNVQGGTQRQQRLFYSCFYRTFLWPVLRSDVDGRYIDSRRKIATTKGGYYTTPSLWDDYRNKLVLLEMLTPEIAGDIIASMTDRGQARGYMPTFFHGDHASAFIAGAYARGVRNFDLKAAYKLLWRNAFVPGKGGRPFLKEYMENGYVAEKDTTWIPFYVECKAAVTKTLEYAYDDYATALIAKELGDKKSYRTLMKRSSNYKNVFDPSTGFFRGRLDQKRWVTPFDPYYPYFAFMYREANAWQSLFFAPHDTKGMLALYPSHKAVEAKLDSLFSEPWRGYEVHNLTGFIGNYCHGNQPGHSIPYTYYFVGRQDKGQKVIDNLLENYYDMGSDHLAYAGMDDAGEMSSWYVCNAMGLYPYSPADPEYIVTIPLFPRVEVSMGDGTSFVIERKGDGQNRRIQAVKCGSDNVKGYFVTHDQLRGCGTLTIEVE